jgi:Leucine-rich repeat (LRR) protein
MTATGVGEAAITGQAKRNTRRWPRYARVSVRGLLVLIVVFSSWLGWTAHRSRVQRDTVAALIRAGGQIEYDWQWTNGAQIPNGMPHWPKWVIDHLDINYLGHVTKVILPADTIRDSHLVRVTQLWQLEEFVLKPLYDCEDSWGTSTFTVTGPNITSVTHNRLPGSKYPKLRRSEVTDAGAATLRHLARLRRLDLRRTQVTDAGLAFVKEIPLLEELDLRGTRVTEKGLEHLKDLTGLMKLDLPHFAFTDSGLMRLKRLKNLRSLRISGKEISDASLANLAGLTGLQELEIEGTQITDRGMAHLKGLTKLSSLMLSDCDVTARGLLQLKGTASLSVLILRDVGIDDAGLVRLKDLTGLRTLWLESRWGKSTAVDNLRKSSPKLCVNFLPTF